MFDEYFKIFFIISGVVFALLAVGFYFLFIKKSPVPEWKKKLAEKYRKLNIANIDRKLLLLELDKLLEYGLKKKYNLDKSLGEILKAKAKKFSRDELNHLWEAHKARNRLVHDVDIELAVNTINSSIITFKKAIKRLIEEE